MKFIHLFFIVIVCFSFKSGAQGIDVDLFVPEEMKTGDLTRVNLDIYKPAGMTTYAQFKQAIPTGFTVVPVELNGASFSIEENMLSVTWLRLPANERVQISWDLKAANGITGRFSFGGVFSYMVDHTQGNIELEAEYIKVVPSLNSNDLNVESHISEQGNTLHRMMEGINCIRRIEYNESKKYFEVEIKFKSKIPGRYNIVEKLPQGYTFKPSENLNYKVTTRGSNVSFAVPEVKADKEYGIKYYLLPPVDSFNKEKPPVYGKLSLIYFNQIITVSVMNQ
jgi:hypothetical protein